MTDTNKSRFVLSLDNAADEINLEIHGQQGVSHADLAS